MRRMDLRQRTPGPPLSGFVEVLWSFQGVAPSHKLERLLPDGSVELVIDLTEDHTRIYARYEHRHAEPLPGCIVSGPHSQFFIIDTVGQCSTVGVHFKP